MSSSAFQILIAAPSAARYQHEASSCTVFSCHCKRMNVLDFLTAAITILSSVCLHMRVSWTITPHLIFRSLTTQSRRWGSASRTVAPTLSSLIHPEDAHSMLDVHITDQLIAPHNTWRERHSPYLVAHDLPSMRFALAQYHLTCAHYPAMQQMKKCVAGIHRING